MLRTSVLAYALASLVHHVHNAVYLDSYPDMPQWLTRGGVYAAWAVVTSIGVLGYVLLRRSRERVGLMLLALYAALGWYGLAHYVVAPFATHDNAMHATIGLEVLAATVLAAIVTARLLVQFRVIDSPK